MKNKKDIEQKKQIVEDDLEGKDEDINLSGESDDYKKGFIDALKWVLEG